MYTCTQADRPSLAPLATEEGGGTAKNEQRAYEREQEKSATRAISESPSVRSADQKRESLPITRDEKGALPIARWCKR